MIVNIFDKCCFFKEGEVECKDEEDLDEFDFIIFEIMF